MLQLRPGQPDKLINKQINIRKRKYILKYIKLKSHKSDMQLLNNIALWPRFYLPSSWRTQMSLLKFFCPSSSFFASPPYTKMLHFQNQEKSISTFLMCVLNQNMSLGQFCVHTKIEGKVQRCPIYLLPPHMHRFPCSIINNPHRSCTFVITDELDMSQLLSLLVYFTVHSWCSVSMGLDQYLIGILC